MTKHDREGMTNHQNFIIPTFEFVSALDIWISSFYGPVAGENGVALARFSVT